MPALMKGKVWADYKHKVVYPVRGEVKCDEIRCHVIVHPDEAVQFLSYAGKPLANMFPFTPSFVELARLTGFTEFDCGFEVNGNFNDSYRWVRSTKKLPDDLVNAKPVFMLYDLPESLLPYSLRVVRIHEVTNTGLDYTALKLRIPHSVPLRSEEDVDQFFASMRAIGHEGVMIKTYDHKYERGKRTNTWLKYKPENDVDGVIEKINMAYATVANEELRIAVGDPLFRAGSVTVRMEDGSSADAHGIRHDLARDMVDNPHLYLGKWCEVKYMERDRQGGYRHPVFNRIREEKA